MGKIYLALAAVSVAFGLMCASCAGKKGCAACAESPRIIHKDGAKLYEFRVGDSEFLMNPEEGALLMSWKVRRADGSFREVVYWPKDGPARGNIETVKGGAPIFFPFSGISFAGGKANMWKTPTGEIRPMRKFGFTDNGKFEIVGVCKNEITLKFVHSDYSKKAYPFDFDLLVNYKFTPKSYTMQMTFVNKSDIALPWGAGTHPYMAMPWRANTTHADYRLVVDCQEAYYVDNEKGVLIQADFKNKSFDNPAMAARIHTKLKSGVFKYGPKSGDDDVTITVNDGNAGPTFSLVTWGKANESPFWAVEPWMVTPLSAGNNAPTVAPHSNGIFKVEVKIK